MFKKLSVLMIVLFMALSISVLQGVSFASSLAQNQDEIELPLTSFVLTTGASLSTSTAPGLEIDNVLPEINWADGETTPVMITFKVPDNYANGGEFLLLVDESSSTTPNQVDFDVYVNGDGATWDSSATNQTPVELAGTAGTPDVVTLTPATDLAGLKANQYVTLRTWRDNTADGTGDLEVYNVRFRYNKKIQ